MAPLRDHPRLDRRRQKWRKSWVSLFARRMRLVTAASAYARERQKKSKWAALDGWHHLHLVEADVPGIGAAPRRPMVTEDIRNLQRWTGHHGRRLRQRQVFVALLRLLARLWQQVERALDAGSSTSMSISPSLICRVMFDFT
jgi:hypothetical protein